ncbi:MAG: hypothetical protein R3242_00700 [Akkermansiaceae bacterium]|nr:hypothetical protein [Akkermansiaceae bacterium]
MKPTSHSRLPGRIRPVTASLAACVGLAFSPSLLMSQGSADAAGEDPSDTTALVKTPSRYVSGEELDAYLEQVKDMLNMKGRATDPFGQVQNPEAKPRKVRTPTLTKRTPSNYRPTAFSDIIDRIEVNTIMPAENRFLIGTRSFELGDRFPIGYRGRKIEVEVIGISSNKIDFKKVEDGEVASLKLKLLPAGMSSGTGGGLSVHGMESNNDNATLQLDAK